MMKEKIKVQEIFGKNKEAYVTSSTHAGGTDLELLKEWLELKSDMVALDIATGGGHVTKTISPYVKTVISTDITKEMLENTANYLSDLTNTHYVIADAENLPFIDNYFDIVTCRIAAHHFPDAGKFIDEVQRVLKPSGKFLFIDNIAPENKHYDAFINALEKMRDDSHIRSRKIPEWKSLLERNKLKLLKETKRKKTLPYAEWVHRTLDSTDKIEKVSHYLNDAPETIQNYYQFKFNAEGDIQSFAIDEWMALYEK
ncbi:SAM-dependent methyltransferase [Oceanobacillus profundus]|uniref:SAM-dependent methyltransferase n=2 Tax=Bacillaceae TaxID=186817 RepID=A0A417YK73_9BACI|nr:SAM-dependent methyltransferase [Oceanobacillus profundus]